MVHNCLRLRQFAAAGLHGHHHPNSHRTFTSGNLSYPRVKTYISSCPSSMSSSPSHGRNGVVPGFGLGQMGQAAYNSSDSSSMEELQSAIQGAIAHCKQSMIANKKMTRVWKIEALEDSGGWLERTTVEDMDIAVRAHLNG